MLKAPLVLLLVLGGCVSVQHHYAMDGAPDDIAASATAAGERLGWAPETRADHSIALPQAPRGEVLARAVPGGLRLTGDLNVLAGAPLLAATTRQLLTGAPGVVPQPKSLPLTLLLDVVFPAAGALYLGPGDLGVLAATGDSWGLNLATRLIFDALVVEMIWLASFAPNPMVFVGLAIASFVLNRVMAVVLDVRGARFVQDLFGRGAAVPTAAEVWRERQGGRRLE